jgi:outer membrane protein assembly factor BamD
MVTLRNQLARHQIHVARFYLRNQAYVAAANRAKTVVEDYQGTASVKDALEILAQAYQHLELEDLRQDILRVIRTNYPDHPLVKQAG